MILGRKGYVLQSEGGEQYKFAVNRYTLVEECRKSHQPRRDRSPAPITLSELPALAMHWLS